VDIYNLGPVTWWESQCIYHALAAMGREGLILCYPTTPYVCIGLHDDLDQEIDQEYCRDRKIPLLRRETGGGVVYLDSHQLFFQLVLHRGNSLLPRRRQQFYEIFLKPAITVYRSFGIPAELRAPADIVVNDRKCSGNAAGDIGLGVAYVGNLLLRFDYRAMSEVLRVPTAAYRQCLYRAMQLHMTTLSDWVVHLPTYSDLANALAKEFAKDLGGLVPQSPDRELMDNARQARKRLTSNEWLNLSGRRQAERAVKIAEGVFLLERNLRGRSAGVLIRDGAETEIPLMESPGLDFTRRSRPLVNSRS
jgi:lipoate-protein ligase A